jgi:hypothetical protein
VQWLLDNNLGRYVACFEQHHVDGQTLLQLDPTDLANMGVTLPQEVDELLEAVNSLKLQAAPISTPRRLKQYPQVRDNPSELQRRFTERRNRAALQPPNDLSIARNGSEDSHASSGHGSERDDVIRPGLSGLRRGESALLQTLAAPPSPLVSRSPRRAQGPIGAEAHSAELPFVSSDSNDNLVNDSLVDLKAIPANQWEPHHVHQFLAESQLEHLKDNIADLQSDPVAVLALDRNSLERRGVSSEDADEFLAAVSDLKRKPSVQRGSSQLLQVSASPDVSTIDSLALAGDYVSMPVLNWGHAEVGDWLTKEGFASHKKSFAKKVDGLALLLLTPADLNHLGVQQPSEQQRLLAAVRKLQGDTPLPRRLVGWTVNDVCDHLEANRLQECNSFVRKAKIDGRGFIKLRRQDLEHSNLSNDARQRLLSLSLAQIGLPSVSSDLSRMFSWSIPEVCDFLVENEMGQYAQAFREHKINGIRLRELNKQALVGHLNVDVSRFSSLYSLVLSG